MKMELIHADGCTTNLGVLGAACNCGAEGQLEADKKVVAEVERRLQLLVDTLGDLLTRIGVLKDDVQPNAQELIMAAETAGQAYRNVARTLFEKVVCPMCYRLNPQHATMDGGKGCHDCQEKEDWCGWSPQRSISNFIEILGDAEIKQVMYKCDYEDSKVSCPMPVTPLRYEIAVAQAEQKNTLKQVYDWGKASCSHDRHEPRRTCPICWSKLQELANGG